MLSSKVKRIIGMLLCGAMLLGLFACAPQDGGEESSSAPANTEGSEEVGGDSGEGTVSSDRGDDTEKGESGGEDLGGAETADEKVTETAGEKVTETADERVTDTTAEEESESASENKTETEKEELDGFEIVENDGKASVKSPEGFEYTVSGYDSIGKNGFAFGNGVSVELVNPVTDQFNRFSVKYRSTTALKIFLSYTIGGTVREDYYFLESGEGTFSGLVPEFLEKKQGTAITKMRVENLEGGEAEFAIIDFSTQIISVPDRDYYIRGGRYTLGIDLGWGGTINYVSDNTCPISGVENMINKHDTGRLVQQSYYGTGAIEGVFEWGNFNGSDKWPYNPVQGGGQRNTASRLIDLVIEEDYVYIKVQPMDWGKSDIKYITPSYMENWYIVEEDYIRVDNRFVDFSGWEHPCHGQEIPAFYTISYLDSFVWYDGVDPWTGDELTWRHELKFWGDSQYAAECSFRIKEPNSETWCAWVSTEDNYGIGLYVPNADRYSAGRHSYNGSKDASADATNYVAPWKQVQIVSYVPLEYSYIICAGSVEEIRETFTEYKDLFDNSSLNENSVSNRQPHYDENMESLDFTADGSERFLIYPNVTNISFDKTEGALKLTSKGGDAHVTLDYLASPYVLNSEDYRYIEIVYMVPTTNSRSGYSCQLFICAGDRLGAAEVASVKNVAFIKDGNYHTLRVRLDDKDFWTGRVNLIRFDYFNTSDNGDVLYIRSIKLTDGDDVSLEKIDFTSYKGMELIEKANKTAVKFDAEEQATKLTVLGSDPYITIDYSIGSTRLEAKDYSKLRITYMVPEANKSTSFCLFLCTGGIASPTPNAQIYNPNGIIADGEYHTLEIDLTEYYFWDGEINRIRFDFLNDGIEGDVFYIASFELVK